MNKKLKLSLQHFADNNDPEPKNQGDGEPQGPEPSDENTFTKSELDSQVSKAVEKAIQKKEQKHQKELEDAKVEARKEAESYAKMTEKEKREKEFSDREKKLADKERDLNLRHLKADVETDLKDNELPAEFADILVLLEDNNKIKTSIKGIKQQFDNAVQAQVKEVTRQNTPASNSSSFSNRSSGNVDSIQEMARNARIIK